MSMQARGKQARSTLIFSPGAAGPTVGRRLPCPPQWTELAECQYTDPEVFFPEKGCSTRDAKKVCLGCEVRAECLEFALENEAVGRFGSWGGTSERERRVILRGRQEREAA